MIKFKDLKKPGTLIPVHINKTRDNTHFWDWSKEHGDWIRGEEIPELLKKSYNTPMANSNY